MLNSCSSVDGKIVCHKNIKRLMYEAVKYNGDIGLLYISTKYNCDYIDSMGNSLLSVAIYSYNDKAFDYLVNIIPIDQLNNKNISPIHMSILVHNKYAFYKLVSMNAFILTKDTLGRSPMSSCTCIDYKYSIAIMEYTQKKILSLRNKKKSAVYR